MIITKACRDFTNKGVKMIISKVGTKTVYLLGGVYYVALGKLNYRKKSKKYIVKKDNVLFQSEKASDIYLYFYGSKRQ